MLCLSIVLTYASYRIILLKFINASPKQVSFTQGINRKYRGFKEIRSIGWIRLDMVG